MTFPHFILHYLVKYIGAQAVGRYHSMDANSDTPMQEKLQTTYANQPIMNLFPASEGIEELTTQFIYPRRPPIFRLRRQLHIEIG